MELYEGANYRINIEGADSTMILDSYNRTLMANIVNSEGKLLIDQDLGEFNGNVNGNVIGVNGKVVVNTQTGHIDVETIFANIINKDGDIVYDITANTMFSNFVGDLYNRTGIALTDIDNKLWKGDVQGNIVDASGTVIFDNETGAMTKDLVGNLYNNNGEMVFDFATNTFSGNFVGNFTDNQGQTVYDAETNTFRGLFNGNIVGNILDSNGTVFIDVESKTISNLQGEFAGTFYGDIYNKIGETFFNLSEDMVNVSVISATKTVSDVIEGALYGDVYDALSQSIVLHAEQRHLEDVTVKGTILNDVGLEFYNHVSDEVSVKTAYIDVLKTEEIEFPNGRLDKQCLILENNKLFSEPAIELRYFRDYEPPIKDWFQIGLEFCLSGGNKNDPMPAVPGNKMPGLTFSAVIDTDNTANDSTASHLGGDIFKTKSYVSTIYAKIPENAEFKPELKEGAAPGDLYFVTGDGNGSANYMIYDHQGKLHVTLADFNVDGETGVEPADTTKPDSWLQVTVNGETKFMPLYS
jgi:hypothetical protein